jgi:hypothetical protein
MNGPDRNGLGMSFGLRLLATVVCAAVTLAYSIPQFDHLGRTGRLGAFFIGALGMACAASVLMELITDRRRP